MNRLLFTLSFLISLFCLSSQSWALPPCPNDQEANKNNCYGTYTWKDLKWRGLTYVGEWKNNKIHGKGILIYPDGEKYEGDFKFQQRDGLGTSVWSNGDKYVGEFKNDKRNGQGIYTHSNGDIYLGENKDDKPHGKGTYTYSQNGKWAGYKYVGEYQNGKRNGLGTFTYGDGSKYKGNYVGEFKDDIRNGQGKHTYYDGKVEEGIWKKDKFMYKNKLTSTSNPKIEEYKSFCSEIGFTPGTEKYGECVVEAMKKG